MKKLLTFFVLYLYFLFTPIANAQSITPDPALNGDSSITYTPLLEDITGNTDAVNIKFNDLSEGNLQFFLCLKTDACLEDRIKDKKLTKTITISPNGISVCADGESSLKTTDSQCSKDDWFHEGKIYRVTLYKDPEMKTREATAPFYVNHVYPTVTITPQNPTLATPIEVTLSGTRKPENKGNNNNYQIVVEGTSGYKKDKCITVKPNTPGVAKFDINGGGLATGSYVIKVNERVSDDRPLGIGNTCEGGFTFWNIPFTVNSKGGTIGEAQQDPNRSDYKSFAQFLNKLTDGKNIILPCGLQESTADPENKRCAEVNTAIGNIPTDPLGFITKLFQIVLAIAGLGATILIIYAGYRLLLSRGDKEVIQAQRERITSAIVGLLFIIFSLVLLSVIAGDVLKIPGFNDNPLPGQNTNQPNTP